MNDKEERIERLEEQVEKLSNAVSMPTRREAMAAGGLLGAGALLGGGVGDAEAATVGQVGTDTDRVDVFGASGDFNSVSTDEASIDDVAARASLGTDQTISSGTITKVNLDTNDIEDTDVVSVDLTNNRLQIQQSGKYYVTGTIRYDGSSNWSTGDRVFIRLSTGGSETATGQIHHGGVNEFIQVSVTDVISVASAQTPLNVEMFGFHNSGLDETINGTVSGTNGSYLSIGRLG